MTTATVSQESKIENTVFMLLKEIAPEANPRSLDRDVDVRYELDIDSFDFLEFLIALEKELNVSVPESDYGKLVSLNDIFTYLQQRLQ